MAITLDGSLGITTPTYGGTTTAEYSVPVTGFKNRIINGNFDIWQRGTTSTLTSVNSYTTADRWFLNYGGTATWAQVTTLLPSGSRYAISVTASAASSYGQLHQYIETANVVSMQGQIMTISCYVKTSGTAYTGTQNFDVGYNATSDVGSAGGWTVITVTGANVSFIPTSSWVKYTAQFTVPSNAVGLYVGLLPSVVQASGNVMYYSQFQAELGSTATSFDYRPYGTELSLCQRYFSKSFAQGTAPFNQSSYTAGFSFAGVGFNSSASVADCLITYPVTMRASPTIVFYNAQGGGAGSGTWSSYDGSDHVGGTPTAYAYDSKVQMSVNFGSGLTVGRGTQMIGNWTASAEL